MSNQYGQGDTSFRAAGGEAGIKKLVEDFYFIMSNQLTYRPIFEMHPADINVSIDKLARFLCGWMGGPARYHEKYGPINIPRVHKHLNITEAERDQWLFCMRAALERQDYSDEFKHYLLQQFSIPANIIMQGSNNP